MTKPDLIAVDWGTSNFRAFLLGAEGDLGPAMGLSREWARNAIKASGNYGEIFTRNLGPDSSLDLARGLNAQWNARPGGLIYALPIR